MIRENRQLVTIKPVEVQDLGKITNHFRGIYRIYPNLIQENRRMPTYNRLDLQTLGSQTVMPKKSPRSLTSFSWFDIRFSFKDSQSVETYTLQMNQPLT